MNGKGLQLNGRKAISLLLALLLLALATAPALAWSPEDEAHDFSTSPQYQRMVQLNGGPGLLDPGHKHATCVSRFGQLRVAAAASPGRVLAPGGR
jgi:hypothetical protein